MKVKKLRLRGYVIPTLSILLIGMIAFSSYKIWELVEENTSETVPTNYVNKSSNEKIYPTISVPSTNIIKPFTQENVSVAIPYYNMKGTDQEQQSALIYYENIYMQNTGIMYASDSEFDVVSCLDGIVKDVKEDSIMGKIVEIEYDTNTTLIYQSLNNVNVSKGQAVKQGEIIGTSGQNPIVENNKYALHFEVYRKGQLQDPEEFYNLTIDDLNE